LARARSAVGFSQSVQASHWRMVPAKSSVAIVLLFGLNATASTVWVVENA
jgi:hypothetical protein